MNPVRFFAAALILTTAVPVAADVSRSDISSLSRGAHRIVVATVTRVDPVFQNNEFGDQLIVSRTQLRIHEVLKGAPVAGVAESVVMELEGGTIGDLTLTVSDLPILAPGERAVIFMRQNARGALVPHERGHGILKLDSSDHVRGTELPLSAIRRAVAAAR